MIQDKLYCDWSHNHSQPRRFRSRGCFALADFEAQIDAWEIEATKGKLGFSNFQRRHQKPGTQKD